MYPAARTLVGIVRAAGATPILFQTWAHRDGWPDYRLDYGAMQIAIDQGYGAIGAELGVTVAPAGQAWQTVLREDPAIALWETDGSHPSAAGTCLAACVCTPGSSGRLPSASPPARVSRPTSPAS